MAGPWEKYQQPTAAPEQAAGPWTKYAQADMPQQDPPLPQDGELGDNSGPLEINIVGGTPIGESQMRSPLVASVSDEAQSLFRADSEFQARGGVSSGAMAIGAAKDMFGSRKGVAEYMAEQSGGRVVRAPDGGYGVILPDGTQYKINDEGADSTDAANIAGNVAAAFLPASWAGRVAQAKNIGTVGRMALQGAVAGGTDAGLQAATSRGSIDPMRVGASVAGGGLGEVAGTGLAALAGKAGQVSRAASGANRRSALNMLADVGIDRPQPSQLAALMPQVEQVRIGADPRAAMGEGLFGFQYTQGQRLTDPGLKFNQLAREEVLRQSPGGNAPFQAAATNNANRLAETVGSIGERLGGRAGASPAELVQGSTTRLRGQADELQSQIDAAYGRVRDADTVAVNRESVASVPQRLRSAVTDFDIHPESTPGAARALAQIQNATGMILGNPNVKGVTLKALDTQRRILGRAVGTAANPTDRAALTVMRREFDGWMDDAVDNALVTGDPAALAQLKEARGLRAEFGRRFEGGRDSDEFIAGLLNGSKTPEELLNVALGASQVSKSGAGRFIQRLKVAANNDPDVMGGLRSAHFNRLAVGKTGDPLKMGDIIKNIKATEYSNASVVKALYEPGEWMEIKRLASALEPMVAKGDFAKSSGSTERAIRALLGFMGGGIKGVPVVGDVIAKPWAVGRNTLQAERAASGRLAPRYETNPIYPAGFSGATEERVRD